jgi:hypothetical protein
MADKRLSKLQKWILMTVYIIGPRGISFGALERLSLSKKIEWITIPALVMDVVNSLPRPWKEKSKYKSKMVSISRTLRNLEDKGLILCFSKNIAGLGGGNPLKATGRIKSITLTPEGEDIAKKLLNVKKIEFNNKDWEKDREEEV